MQKTTVMLEDFRLKVFVTVAKERSFTKAAEVLGVTQPAVSQNIAELEKGLETRLFDRLRSEVVLTEEGKVFLRYADRILSAAAEADMLFSSLSQSTVRIAASEEIYTYFISPALESFSKVHPTVKFERAMFDDADLIVSISLSSASPFEIPADSIARLRVSASPAPKMGDFAATHETNSYFDLLYQPTQAFACTKTCRLLKDYFASLL